MRSSALDTDGNGETTPVCHSHDFRFLTSLCFPDLGALFSMCETPIDEGLFYVDQAVDFELCSKSLQNSSHHSGLDPLLESAMAGLVRRTSIRKCNPEHPCVKLIRYRSELPPTPSRADPGRHVAWRALGLGVKDLPLLVCQVTFMAHFCVDAVKQSAHRRQPAARRRPR